MKYGTRRDKSSQETPFPSSPFSHSPTHTHTTELRTSNISEVVGAYVADCNGVCWWRGSREQGAGSSGFGHLYPQLQLTAGGWADGVWYRHTHQNLIMLKLNWKERTKVTTKFVLNIYLATHLGSTTTTCSLSRSCTNAALAVTVSLVNPFAATITTYSWKSTHSLSLSLSWLNLG